MTIPDDNLSAAESDLFKAVPREATLANRVTGQIEALIVEGRLQPGQRLPSERELADQFGVSRTVVREAVRGLVAKGLLEVRPGSGTLIRSPSARAVSQSMTLFLRAGQPQLDYAKVHEIRRVTEAGAPERVVASVLEQHGRIDILVNNAGIARDQLMLRMKRDDWDQVLATNLTAAFSMVQAVLKPMIKQRGGRIISVTSVVGQTGNAGQANYAASKAGLIGFTKSMARELASRNITVNAVAPGLIETDMTRAIADKATGDWMAQIPLGRIGRPEDVAAAVCFLASDEASYITGQVLAVNGGMYM